MGDRPVAVEIHKISKRYKLFKSPQERLLDALRLANRSPEEFWALREVDLTVRQGETLGIIGRNGSGKSTLLQLICGIGRPTSGVVTVRGRVTALLELGAGFNPEFSGRENVLLYGAQMGFSQRQMLDRLGQIQAFAEIGEFLDQPMKCYSSGMFLRLAFSAAIHVDPDILAVDEALAVGDARFQHKCYRKLHELRRAGRTILLVTHDMHAISRLCDQAVLLDKGSVMERGEPKAVVHRYHELIRCGEVGSNRSWSPVRSVQEGERARAASEGSNGESELDRFLLEVPAGDQCPHRRSYNPAEHRYGDGRGEILDYAVFCRGGREPGVILSGDQVDIYLKVRFREAVQAPLYGIALKAMDGVYIYGTNTRFAEIAVRPAQPGEVRTFRFSVQMSLSSGDYFVDLGLAEKLPDTDAPLDVREDAIHIFVESEERFAGLVRLEARLEEIPVRQDRAGSARPDRPESLGMRPVLS